MKETLSTVGQEKSRLTPTCTYMDDMQERCFSLLKLDLNIKKKRKKKKKKKKKKKDNQNKQKWLVNVFFRKQHNLEYISLVSQQQVLVTPPHVADNTVLTVPAGNKGYNFILWLMGQCKNQVATSFFTIKLYFQLH